MRHNADDKSAHTQPSRRAGNGALAAVSRAGIGAKLLHATLIAARDFGLHRVELTVRQDNAHAIALYKKAGFDVEGEQRDAIQIDGVYENIVCMAKLF